MISMIWLLVAAVSFPSRMMSKPIDDDIDSNADADAIQTMLILPFYVEC